MGCHVGFGATSLVLSRSSALLRRATGGGAGRGRLFTGPVVLMGLALGVFSVLALGASPARSDTAAVSTDPADIQAGAQLFAAHCQSCHGYQGLGGQTSAPALVSVGAAAADFYLSTGRMPLNNPADQPLRHRPFFDSAQIRQLVAYINALPEITGVGVGGPTIPVVEPVCPPNPSGTGGPGCVSLSEGQGLFVLNCAQCHQASGAGGALSQGIVVPSLRPSSAVQVGEAIRVGPPPMPVFGPGQLTDSQVSAIARYVESLRGSAVHGPGGITLGRFGPVAEGFVAILVGFGLLLLASRLIGTRG